MEIVDEGFMEEALRRFDAREDEAEAALVECDLCTYRYDPSDIEKLDGKHICWDCVHDYLNEQFGRFGDAFLAQSVKRYLESQARADDQDMFYNCWLAGLEKADRARILKEAYEREKARDGSGYYPDDEMDFCTQAEYWQDFVREKIREETQYPHTA